MTQRRPVVGVMGQGEGASAEDLKLAEDLGELIALEGWILLTGGRATGVMRAAICGAKRVKDSLTIGVLPSTSGGEAPELDIAIFTGMGDARNVVNVLSSDVVVICGVPGAGTASEAALAVKAKRRVLMLRPGEEATRFFQQLDPSIAAAETPLEIVGKVRDVLSGAGRVPAHK